MLLWVDYWVFYELNLFDLLKYLCAILQFCSAFHPCSQRYKPVPNATTVNWCGRLLSAEETNHDNYEAIYAIKLRIFLAN